jgi:hypothetical protein
MRHRIININTNLGNSSKCLLSNTWSNNDRLNKIVDEMFQEALNLKPIEEYGGFDFLVENEGKYFRIDFGYEPAYKYDEMLVYHIEEGKANCSIIKGKAEGLYGSDIKINENVKYDDLDTEFKEFVDKWHDKLLECLN